MRRCVAIGFSLVVLGVGLAAPSSAAAPKGHLLVVGGNGTTDEIVRRAVETAKGPSGLVVVFPQASELESTGQEAVAMWKQAGIGQAVLPDLGDVKGTLEAIGKASFIWFPGGDQERLMKALGHSGIPEAIRARYQAGALVGGTSAGAAVMSAFMITGEADLTGIIAGRTVTAPGLALWPEVIVDQHFLKRQRNNRLISAVLDRPGLVGVGIDETTAVFVSGRRFEVLGKSSVLVVDARKASVTPVGKGALAAARRLRMAVLTSGMQYDLDKD